LQTHKIWQHCVRSFSVVSDLHSAIDASPLGYGGISTTILNIGHYSADRAIIGELPKVQLTTCW